MNFGFAAKNLLRAAAVVAIASGTSACSSVPGWMNPFGDDNTPSADDTAAPANQTAANDPNDSPPNLADVPDRPVQTSTPDSQRQVASSLAADRAQTKYSGETLRGDAQTAAAPPPPPSTVDTTMADSGSSTSTTTTTTTTAATDTTPAAPPPPSSSDDSSDTQTASADDSSAAPPAPAVGTAPPPPAPATRVAAATPPPVMAAGDGRPAVPPLAAGASVPGAQGAMMSDSQLGFQASSAPPLDASVSQFVAPSIISHYRQTAGGGVAVAGSAVPASGNTRASRRSSRGMGGPEQMSGAVVANLGVLSDGTTAGAPVAYAPAAGSPSAVVFFPGDTTILSASAKAQIRAAAESFRTRGSSGFIRVVGHASSRTGNMPLERHLVVIFEKSQQRANSVAQELIKDGVPADKVLVEAVGDSQPVFYESMPKGEDGNRRAEIFLQG